MALHLKLKPKTLCSFRTIHRFSTSSPPPDDSNAAADAESAADSPPSPPPPSYSSYFSDIKERLKSPSPPPRRIPTDPPPPPNLSPPNRSPAASLDDIRRHLADFRPKSNAPPSPGRPSSPSPLSFQELFKNNVLKPSDGAGAGAAEEKGEGLSFSSIRESLRQFRPPRDQRREGSFNLKLFQDSLRGRMGESPGSGAPLIGGTEKLPDSIFGKELRRKMGEKEEESEGLKTEFVKIYSHEELGEKLRRLRPPVAAKGGKDWFSLTELNERLAKLRVLEEKEADSRMGGVSFRDLRESLVRLKDVDVKKANTQRISILAGLGGLATPAFMLKPPQEHLMENFFHPDHMSSAEKMKLELKRVRDDFKMSESDCGSSRVQIAQLTTKIKHLSSVLHKKDKHSRKGLHEMVQRRKKLLKYLRRTDWDSYCLVLSKLGLRDVPEYKTPDYKS